MLAMQTRPESIESCPHCSYSGPRSQFQPVGGGGAAPLPMQRRVIHRHGAPASKPQPAPAAPVYTAPPQPHVAAGHQRFSPSAATYAPPPQTAPPPQPQPTVPVTPQGPPSAWDPYTGDLLQPLPALPETPLQGYQPSAGPTEPSWPGHGLETAATQQDTFASISQPPQRTAPAILPVFVPQETIATVPSQRPGMSWGNTISVWFLSLVILAGGGYLIWDWWKTQQDNQAAQNAEEALRPRPSKPLPGSELPTDLPMPPPAELEAARQEATARQIDLVVASTEAQAVVDGVFKSPTMDERLTFIDGGAEHRDAVEKFFAEAETNALLAVKRFPIAPLWLPGKEPFPLFQVITKGNRAGAMARLNKGADGRYRLNWPMFEESHANRVHQFIDDPPAEARWFYSGLRRSHGLELEEKVRENYHAFDFQGSPNDSARVFAYASKNTSVGRFFSSQMAWGGVYMARVLVRWSDLAPNRQGILILACEGEDGEDKTQPAQVAEPVLEVRKPDAMPKDAKADQ